MDDVDLATLQPGHMIGRQPAGYLCTVITVERPLRVRVKDVHSLGRTYWVSWKTLKASWRRPL